MGEVKIEPSLFDPTAYWEASANVQALLAIPNDQVTNADREAYAAGIGVIDQARQDILDGQTTGRSILDRLIGSGQMVSAEELEQLDAIEQMLITGQPVLWQLGKSWRVGITVHDELYFSPVHRNSYFAPLARGYQAIPTA